MGLSHAFTHFHNSQPSSEDKKCDKEKRNGLFTEKASGKVKMAPFSYLHPSSVM